MQTLNLIAGEWVGAPTGATFPVTDPATDDVVAEVPRGGAEHARAAIDAAAAALPGWRALTAADRARPLRRLAELMVEQRERLARLMTREQGKPLAEARGEIDYAASFIEHAAEEGKRVLGEVIPASRPGQRIVVLRQPVGVVAAITPWNFPAAMITRKLGPALAAGCTIVVKPAEQTPLSALALGELSIDAGIPRGVINIVTGDAAAIGEAIFADARVRKVSFTGSTEVGRKLMVAAAPNVVRLSLELGGHAPFLVFDDADVDAAVTGAIKSKFRNAGQTCICPNRFFVQDGVYDEFVGKLAKQLQTMVLGSGLDDAVSIGPLIDDDAVAKVRDHIEDARARGAIVRTGGEIVRPGPGLTARFCRPTLLEGVDASMKLSVEETFGPVAPVRRFSSEAQAIELANASPFGLASYFYTRDASRLWRVAERLEYGIVGANDGAPSTAQAPFGGVKTSGFGREGGHHVMHEYLDVKYVSIGITEPNA
ncbi:NAD-dependent succinate-semialdehyde dehydrogenase [Paraliomyxa miuraensis]|uniref:NAD-dependent succinate-semialdehyde dehydrogenase n=1 Tax=Paraliomyxa miuraensis TaxID=376150 RepID=UPI0022579265|nr:NAD-dependent succinate-semialdehyde dehydrogenase [Paraliomyxa miuraensis]MCX4246520.1 NAD-dependent succinate-semialdehyde dehydrogenase [Paraliomyxa miuraensis]